MFWMMFLFSEDQPKKKVEKKVEVEKDKKWAFLDKTFRGTLNTDGGIQAEQEKVRADFEKFPQARAAFFPKIGVDAGMSFNGVKTTQRVAGQLEPLDKTWFAKQTINLNFEQNLFRGFADKAAVDQSKELILASIWEYFEKVSRTFMEVIRNVEDARFQWASINATKTSVKVKTKVWDIAKAQHRSETIPLFQLKTAESESQRVNAKLLAEMAELEKFRASYREKTGHELFEADVLPLPEDLPKTYEEAEKLMLVGNYDVKRVRIRLKAIEKDKTKAQAEFLPRVDFSTGVEYRRNFDHGEWGKREAENFSIANIPGQPPQLVKNKKIVDVNNIRSPNRQIEKRVGLNIRYNLFNGGTDLSRKREAIRNIGKARQEMQLVLQQKRAELKAAWMQYQNALKSKVSLERAFVGFQAAYNGIFGQYQEGAKTVRDVLDEEEKLDNAKRELANNEKVLRSAAWQLTMLLGKLNPESLGLTIQTFKPFEESKLYG